MDDATRLGEGELSMHAQRARQARSTRLITLPTRSCCTVHGGSLQCGWRLRLHCASAGCRVVVAHKRLTRRTLATSRRIDGQALVERYDTLAAWKALGISSVGHRLKLLDARAALLAPTQSGGSAGQPEPQASSGAGSEATQPLPSSSTLYAGAGSPDTTADGWGEVTEARFYDVFLPQVMARRGTPWHSHGTAGPEVTPQDYLEQHASHVTGATG